MMLVVAVGWRTAIFTLTSDIVSSSSRVSRLPLRKTSLALLSADAHARVQPNICPHEGALGLHSQFGCALGRRYSRWTTARGHHIEHFSSPFGTSLADAPGARWCGSC